MKAMSIWIIVGACLALEVTTSAATERCADMIPQSIKTALDAKYPQWHPVEVSDLNQDDQGLWKNKFGEQCPSVVIGRFTPDTQPSVAVLIRTANGKRHVRMLLGRISNGELASLDTLLSTGVTNYPVIHRESGGEYRDFYDRTKVMKTSLDVIFYEQLEAQAIAFLYTKKGFRKVVVSD